MHMIACEYSWVVKIRNTSEAVIGLNTPLGHYTDSGPTGVGQYDSLGEYLCLCVLFRELNGRCGLFLSSRDAVLHADPTLSMTPIRN